MDSIIYGFLIMLGAALAVMVINIVATGIGVLTEIAPVITSLEKQGNEIKQARLAAKWESGTCLSCNHNPKAKNKHLCQSCLEM